MLGLDVDIKYFNWYFFGIFTGSAEYIQKIFISMYV